jgi:acetyltransferase-like isoleucine patch superfamily enzyme
MNKLFLFFKKYEFPVHLFIGWTIVCVQASTLFHTAVTKLKLKALGCTVGKGFKIDGKLWIWAQKKGCVRIGDNVKINSRFGSNLVGITNPAVFQCLDKGKIIIGNHCGISSPVFSTRSSITIGNNVMIGGNVRIFDHNYHSLDFLKRRNLSEDQSDCKRAPVVIGNDVFIGTNAIILKGVTIGDRSIVGAGSVVVSSIPSDEIWAGNPAVCVSRKKSI